MKPTILLLFFSLPLQAYSQITFEKLSTPRDFSMGTIWKSPVGEYFVQANRDRNTIYTSTDGTEWEQVWLPRAHELYDIEFYSDGTPLIKPEKEIHMIRREGIWFIMNAGGGDFVKTSFIKDDTLFIYHENTFSFSLDKGQNFTTVFTYDGSLIDNSARLWKFDQHFILYHTSGSSDRLSVFDMQGQRVLSDTLELGYEISFTYNQCGQVLINDDVNYYLVKEEEELEYQTGYVMSVIPQLENEYDIQSEGGVYYARTDTTLYKTTGCNFAWYSIASEDLVGYSKEFRISPDGDIFLIVQGYDFYNIFSNGIWKKEYPDINHPYVVVVNESGQGHQYSVTSNNLFSKTIDDQTWTELDTIGFPLQYSPGGDLYIARTGSILYSTDNGQSFTTISLPVGYPLNHYHFKVLDDDILFLNSTVFGPGFYSINNGQDWIEIDLSFYNSKPTAKLIGDDILIADIGYKLVFSKVNMATNQLSSVAFDHSSYISGSDVFIMDDGTVYVRLSIIGSSVDQYYHYRDGEELKFIGPFPELDSYEVASSGNQLFAFGREDYYEYNGQNFIKHDYNNLPTGTPIVFSISENEYLYAIVDGKEIYRSFEPLSLQIRTKEPDSFLDLTVFPNPASDNIILSFHDSDPQPIDTYVISDHLGRVVQQSGLLHHQAINVSLLIPGIYNLILKENGMIVGMKKFVKL